MNRVFPLRSVTKKTCLRNNDTYSKIPLFSIVLIKKKASYP